MTIVGYSHDPAVSVIESEVILESLLKYPEIIKVLPGADFCEFDTSEAAPKTALDEITWFVEQAHKYLTANIVLGNFTSEEHYYGWVSSLDEQQAAAVKYNRVHLNNMLRINRLVAGFTTEAFAKQLASQIIHDKIMTTYTDFNGRHSAVDFYQLPTEDRLQFAVDMETCLVKVIRLLEDADFIKCQS